MHSIDSNDTNTLIYHNTQYIDKKNLYVCASLYHDTAAHQYIIILSLVAGYQVTYVHVVATHKCKLTHAW